MKLKPKAPFTAVGVTVCNHRKRKFLILLSLKLLTEKNSVTYCCTVLCNCHLYRFVLFSLAF